MVLELDTTSLSKSQQNLPYARKRFKMESQHDAWQTQVKKTRLVGAKRKRSLAKSATAGMGEKTKVGVKNCGKGVVPEKRSDFRGYLNSTRGDIGK